MRSRERPPWWRMVDWRVVAAVGLPVWAAAGGIAFGYKSRPAAAQRPADPPPEFVGPPAPPAETSPGGPLLWYHLAAAVTPTAAAPRPDPTVLGLAGVEARLRRAEAAAEEARKATAPRRRTGAPPAEIDGCKTFNTYVAWQSSPAEAMRRALEADKLAFVLHLAGNIEDDGFT